MAKSRTTKSPALKKIFGQPSYQLMTKEVKVAVTQIGGHLGPVTFMLGRRAVAPFSVAPWHSEKFAPKIPRMLRVLRGDFFCLPFGGNETPFRGEKQPPHGETPNNRWRLEKITKTAREATLSLSMTAKISVRTNINSRFLN